MFPFLIGQHYSQKTPDHLLEDEDDFLTWERFGQFLEFAWDVLTWGRFGCNPLGAYRTAESSTPINSKGLAADKQWFADCILSFSSVFE